jgi:D-glycero-D-manno-heptose 1,7-bisphosphate phosphatase
VRTAFLDRDGTINVKAPAGDYVTGWDRFAFIPGAVRAIRLFQDSGWRVVVVSNQRGIALGRMSPADLDEIHRRMRARAPVDAIYHCPHDRGMCRCRKPGPGMFEDALRDLPGIDLASAVVIGDADSDMEAGRALGCETVRVGDPPWPSLLDVARRLCVAC